MGSGVSGKRVAVLGAGKMGGILLQALLKEGLVSSATATATVQHAERAKTFRLS
jgi:pyrroline-5-carboxylate reductase